MFDNDYVTASFDTLMRQAPDTVALYLRKAKEEIDSVFGEGYAANNPELVAAFLNAASADMGAATLAKVFGSALQEISSAIGETATAIEN